MNGNWSVPTRRTRIVPAVSPFSAVQKNMLGWMDDILNSFGEPLSLLSEKQLQFTPRLEVHEDESGLTVRAEMPGMKVEDVEISLTRDGLTIRGERRDEFEEKRAGNQIRSEWLYGSFQRTIPLHFEVEEDKVDASVKDGILTIRLPKTTKARSETRKVSIRQA